MSVAQHVNAVDIRHLDISDDEVVEGTVDLPLRGLASIDRLDLVAIASQRDIQHFADRALIIAHQDISHALFLPRPRPALPHQLSSPATLSWMNRQRAAAALQNSTCAPGT